MQLDTLNVSNNLIKKISGLAQLTQLKTLQITHNFLRDADSIRGLLEAPSLTVIDLSYNKLEDPEIMSVFSQMPEMVYFVKIGSIKLDA